MSPVFSPLRPAFLILTPACVALGVALAYRSGTAVSPMDIALVLLGALAAHGAVNALNEYSDFHTGLDAIAPKTPFSGGSGTLPTHPELAPQVLALGLGASAVTAAVGGYFLVTRGFALLAPGLLGLLLVLAYTPWLTRRPWLCLVAPGLGFGPCMVAGTTAALTGKAGLAAWLASLVPFFLVNNLLLLNQFPDAEADRRAGRLTLPILIGRPGCVEFYRSFLGLAAASLLLLTAFGWLPVAALAGLLGLVPGLVVARGIARSPDDMATVVPYMGWNVATAVTTPALVALGTLTG